MNSTSLAVPHSVSPFLRPLLRTVLIVGGLLTAALLVWQGITAEGSPDPTQAHGSPTVVTLDIAVLVFREGLECILVLSAITASLTEERAGQKRPIFIGAGVAFLVTLVTWFIAVGILSDLTGSVSALDLQAGTGLLAVVVLIVVMNWFFHKIYWGGWISLHHRKKKELQAEAVGGSQVAERRLLLGLGLLGFASLYREGVEVVLILQSYRLQLGGWPVFYGTLFGLFLSGIIAVLNFIAHRRLPYRKMLIFTGLMLGVVLLVMVGEQAYEMQQAHWISTTELTWLAPYTPDWTGVWFSVFPTVETLAAQALAALIVIGSYFAARWESKKAEVRG